MTVTQIDIPPATPEGGREKRRAALSSVLAAFFLTSVKIVVGILTGSLGILSEAAHSGLDLVAAAITYFAVRLSGKPPDPDHPYGHGKIENLSALFETLLLLGTCVWIIYEALSRLFHKQVEVEASIWSFVVMGVSILVDLSRSRMLARVAKKYNSQALEADALHFSTDIWSSSVVIGGLFLVSLARWIDQPWLVKADAVAALGVAGIVAYVSLQLGRKTIDDLLDAFPPGLREEVAAAARVPGVRAVRNLRLRRAGPEVFADTTLTIDRDTGLEAAHQIATQAEAAIQAVVPGADVIVNVSPVASDNETILTRVRLLAHRQSLGAHGIRIYSNGEQRFMELHLEVSETLTLDEAHTQAIAFEQAVRQEFPDLQDVAMHLEPAGDITTHHSGIQVDEQQVRAVLLEIANEMEPHFEVANLRVQHASDEYSVSFHCIMSGDAPITDAHWVTVRIESALRDRVPGLGRVLIEVVPPEPQT